MIVNALKFKSTSAPSIRISAEESDEGWLVRVSDNGIGFAKDNHKLVFKMFHRLNGDKYDGEGLGLSMCKKIVEIHGGRIWAESKQDSGATFVFTLNAVAV